MEISKRCFLKGMGRVVASTFLPNVATASGLFTAHSNDYDSLDELTKRMLEKLGKATRVDVKDHKPTCLDNASFSISACIKGYNIEYWAFDHGIEELIVTSEKKYWDFSGEGSLEKGITYFYSDEYNVHQTKHPIMEYALPICKRIRDLLDINVHLQDWKGRDLTPVVYTLSKKVLSVKDFKVEHKDGLVLASYKKEDFSIKYESNNRGKEVDFTVRDGENWLRFFVGYDKSNNIDGIYLYVNNSYFWVDYSWLHPYGKLDRFPKKVYSKASVMNIVNKGKEIERYLTSTIANIKHA